MLCPINPIIWDLSTRGLACPPMGWRGGRGGGGGGQDGEGAGGWGGGGGQGAGGRGEGLIAAVISHKLAACTAGSVFPFLCPPTAVQRRSFSGN